MYLSGGDSSLHSAVRDQFRSALPPRLGIALSGGGDSTALMHLLHECFAEAGVSLHAATVDHGLRPGSAEEAQDAAAAAAALGIPHQTLRWQEGPGPGNLQDQAREARYGLLTAWARENAIPVLALGHTADDQAETVLMRLGRAAGVSGLSGMPVRRTRDGVTLLRPLLGISRAQLRSYLRDRGIAWSEDPSNEDARFERVRMRQALAALEPLGLTVKALAAVAQNMAKARDALDWYVFLAARDLACIEAGAVVLSQRKFRTLPDEIGHRVLVRALQWVSGSRYPPRRVPMLAAAAAARKGGSATLAGCRVIACARQVWVCREYNAVRRTAAQPGDLWDGRWQVYGGDAKGCELRALGRDGLKLCPDWRSTGVPGAVLEATPAVWRGAELVAAPAAGLANGWTAAEAGSEEDFFASLLSH
ncbi:tRNA lysidine(34) synthetase TilS [Cribrihabitans pelagius]|uniref:tRNA lysidine(34) synthetase TilS n=1 Tax=Cribrihabitans pelagius TaxID=1765746 RepID=UPI003B5A2899